MSILDEKYMHVCFELALKGSGYVSPNPLVGAVIVKDGQIISTGYHQRYGEAHAERNAVIDAKQNISGATLYCNLEPCVHNDKQTPPCVSLIINNGIKKVVISNIDPNPKVNGRGIQKLKDAGIEVVFDVLEQKGKELNRFFFKSIKTGLPYVTVKMAISSDGKITAAEGSQTWLSCEGSIKFVHRQRSIYDAVLVGANTVNIDNPKLTVRNVSGRNPIRIILDGNLNSRIEAEIFKDKSCKTLVFCSANADEKKKNNFMKSGIELIELENGKANELDIRDVLLKLYKLKISSLFVEGGGIVFDQFISQNLFDEIIVLKAPVILQNGINAVPIDTKKDLFLFHKEQLDRDQLRIYKSKTAEHVHGNH